MDPVDLKPLVSTLSTQIDSLEDALEPLIKTPPHLLAAQLPLLDKSKLFVSTAYAIESLLFSTLLLNGQNAKTHPIFTELTRLKQYHTKIRDAETPDTSRARLDKGAAARFIKHGLSGNERYDAERAERIAREKGQGKEKRKHIKFGENGGTSVVEVVNESAGGQIPNRNKRKSEGGVAIAGGDADAPMLDADAEVADQDIGGAQDPPRKKSRLSAAAGVDDDDNEEQPSSPVGNGPEPTGQLRKQVDQPRKSKGALKREKQRLREEATGHVPAPMTPEEKEALKAQKRERKAQRKAGKAARRGPFGQAVGRDLEAEGTELLLPQKQGAEPGKYSEALEGFVEMSIEKAEKQKKSRRQRGAGSE